MAKKNRKKQEAVPYEFIQEVNKMSKDEIANIILDSVKKVVKKRKKTKEDWY